ncbi:MAG: glycoside hydrolase family 88 protein [Clostridia bacterium]|nr:glycoside hydrolase family 88 protein [Clostridia bacterium]
MSENSIKLNNPEKYLSDYEIPSGKIEFALKNALGKMESQLDRIGIKFPANSFEAIKKYEWGENENWTCGMHTGKYLLAYELSGNQKFLDLAKAHIPTYKQKRIIEKKDMHCHDVGFVFVPSMVALYKLTGCEECKDYALQAAEMFYNISYSKKGKFIIRSAHRVTEEWACRTMVDTMLNIPLLFWAGEETGNKEYTDAAIAQADFTAANLVREDGSSYHHYQFDVETHAPLHGCTFQGNRDESTWTRGHSWCVLGFPIAYSYTGDKKYLETMKKNTYYMLNHLPEDLVPYWDYDFTTGSAEPRDASAGVIAACGMMEAMKYIDKDSEDYKVYRNASARLIEAAIDNCAVPFTPEYDLYDGLIDHNTGSKPHGSTDRCAVYGDYFYLEALLRYTNPDWKKYW